MASEIVVDEFVAEAREHLDSTECDLIAIENGLGEDDPETVNRVFRAIHSIKGASGTFGFPAVMELSHAVESVLLLIRDGQLTPDRDRINALLEGVDKLRFMVNDIHASNEVDYHCELFSLREIVQGEGKASEVSGGGGRSAGKTEEATTDAPLPLEAKDAKVKMNMGDCLTLDDVAFQVEKAQIDSALSRCHYVYSIRVCHGHDLEDKQRTLDEFLAKLESYGQCLDVKSHGGDKSPESNEIPMDGPCHVLLATILEPDLVEAALEIPDEQIQLVDPEALQAWLRKETAPHDLGRESQSGLQQVCVLQTSETAHQAPETIRVNVELLDTLINLAGELVLGRNQLRQMLEALVDGNPRLRTVIQNVNLVTSEMQEHILRMRMQPVRSIINRVRRMVRDLAGQLSKEVRLGVEGNDVELDRSILEGLVDPLIHIIRNCVDHGIEMPDERIARGKSPTGEIRLSAFHEAGQVKITIADDGRGIDVDQLVQKAAANGILTLEDAGKINEKEKISLVFLPGLSTAKTVTDISGRGVGMDVVKNNIEKLGGHIEIDSLMGSGTTIRITVPLTLAIIPSLIVGAAKQRFAIPQVNVRELVCIRADDPDCRVEQVGEASVLRLRERLLPLVRLTDTVGLTRTFVHPATGEEATDRRMNIVDRRKPGKDPEFCGRDRRNAPHGRRSSRLSDIFVVVLRVGCDIFGLIVDELFDIEEIVVKPLSDHIKDCQCFAGATVMGDGRVAMILDAAGIAALAKLRFAEIEAEERRRQEEEQCGKHDSRAECHPIIVFNNSPHEYFAMPLSSIARLEKIASHEVERIGNHEFINHFGKALPLIRLETYLPVRPLPASPEELYVIIPKANNFTAGILASKIIDTFESRGVVERVKEFPRGFLGTSIVNGQITMFLDADELLRMFRDEIIAGKEDRGIWNCRGDEAVCILQG